MKRIAVVLLAVACTPPPAVVPPADAGAHDAGTSDGGLPEPDDAGAWAWLPVAGSRCGAGATAGFAQNVGATDELFIFLQGGGACWNRGTCVPSLLEYGPLCDYGPNLCLADAQGGTQPTAAFVTHPDPYPADGGGALPADLRTLSSVKALDRLAADNPFRRATFVYVPYCTGDLHSGRTQRSYTYKYGAFDPDSTFTMNFWGAANMDAYLARLVALYPNVRRVWLTGASGGAFGATLNLDRVQRAFPAAEVHLLADSGPFVNPVHFAQWRDTWAMEFPQGCTTCDAGFPAVLEHLATTYPTRRIALLSYDRDRVIAWFFFAPQGAVNFLNPPLDTFQSNLVALEGRYDGRPNTKYFVVPGEQHVLWGTYGTRLADGGYSAPLRSRDGGTDIKAFIDGWAVGAAGWNSSR